MYRPAGRGEGEPAPRRRPPAARGRTLTQHSAVSSPQRPHIASGAPAGQRERSLAQRPGRPRAWALAKEVRRAVRPTPFRAAHTPHRAFLPSPRTRAFTIPAFAPHMSRLASPSAARARSGLSSPRAPMPTRCLTPIGNWRMSCHSSIHLPSQRRLSRCTS